MTQENEVTHSPTNTAARELLASALDECGRPTDAAEVREGRNPFVRGEYALAAIESALAITLETPDGLPLLPVAAAWMHVDAPEYESPVYTADQMRAYATAALRTKQPAASEGDVDWAKFPYSDAWCDGLSATLWECGMPNAQRQVEEIKDFVRVARANTSKQASGEAVAFQSRVQPWMLECFGAEIAGDMVERGDRFLEESLELLQAHGYDRSRVATLVDYVWSRSIGEPAQEVGGVMVTLAAYCLAAGIDMHEAGETELARILRPEIIEKIRRKQASKNGIHTPLPTPPRHPADEALIAAYDAGFAASDEGWNAEIWPDVESRPDYYVKDRAEAIAALQAGTP